jgi:hypothetical protein
MKPTSAQQTYADLYSLIDGSGRICDNEIKHRHYFRIAGITACVESGLDFETVRFKNELMAFAVDGPGEDNITLRHHFFLPDLKGRDLGVEVYRKAPWVIYRKNGSWIYRGILPMASDDVLHRFALFSSDYKRAVIYSPESSLAHIREHGFQSLSLFPTDQIWLTPLLADRQALLLHSAAAVINGQGFIFVGHSDAGKSTTIELLKQAKDQWGLDAQILCDDRNVVRRWPDGWQVHGTWSHGDVTDVSPADAPLKGVFFLEQALENKVASLDDRKQIWKRLLATLIRAAVTSGWWQKEMDIMERLIDESSFYRMRFDKTGAVVPELDKLTR